MTFPVSKSRQNLENGTIFTPKFDKTGLIPCIVTDADSAEVVMYAFMNAESLRLSIKTREAHYWSRSRRELWHKGATSGSIQNIIDMRTDCDQDVIWISVTTMNSGANCHTGQKSCFYRKIVESGSPDEQIKLEKTSTPALFDPKAVYGDK